MDDRRWNILGLALLLVPAPTRADGPRKPEGPPRKILVELLPRNPQDIAETDPAPPAGSTGGPESVITLNFRAVPNSASFRRRSFYDEALDVDPAEPPFLVIDGRRKPVAGGRDSTPAGVSIQLDLNGTGRRKSLTAKVASRSASVVSRELLVGLALTEDPVSIRLRSGENPGHPVMEHHVVRRLVEQTSRFEKAGSKTLTFPIEIAEDDYPGRFRVAVFVQDRLDGSVYQADSIPWINPPKHPESHAKRKPARPAGGFGFVPFSLPNQGSDITEDTVVCCPTCGALSTLGQLLNQPSLRHRMRPLDPSSLPMPMC